MNESVGVKQVVNNVSDSGILPKIVHVSSDVSTLKDCLNNQQNGSSHKKIGTIIVIVIHIHIWIAYDLF